MVVMSEFLVRGWNVGIPEVDVGDDIFVVRDSDGDFHRVQVKTANARGKLRLSASYSFPLEQLRTPSQPEVTYVMVIRNGVKWTDFIVIRRTELWTLHSDGMGNKVDDRMILRLKIREETIFCGDTDLSRYRNNWDRFPVIDH